MNTYTDAHLMDVSGAIGRLPDLPLDASLPLVERKSEAATGTDGKSDLAPQTTSRMVAPIVAPTTDVSVHFGSFPGNADLSAADPRNAKNAEKTSVFPAFLAERVTGVEPATTSLEG